MPPRIELAPLESVSARSALLVVVTGESPALDPQLEAVDVSTGRCLSRTLDARDFRGARDEALYLAGGAEGPERMLLAGTGVVADRASALRRAAAVAARQANRLGAGSLAFYGGKLDERDVEAVATGLIAGAWEYNDTRTPPPETERRRPLESATILAEDNASTRRGLAAGIAIGEGHSLARRLAMMPGNLCTPEFLAETARDIGKRHSMKVTVLGRAEMEKEGMGALLAVAQGSPEDPKLIALEYRRGREDAKPVVLVGKGLCFDTGGISIKPAQGMELMKFDMCGAAGVLGAMEAIARLDCKLNVIGLIGATTNMPSGTAYKPGDVIKSHLGKFVEIVNTDAEGRLVLADVLSYARRYDPEVVIDAATLTGAVVIALGHTATAIYSSDDALAAEAIAAGKRAGEPGWVLPLWEEYKELIKSDIADMKNAGGRPAGSISAAMFLKEFAEGFPWIHMDIAGTAYSETDLTSLPKGPTGVPVGTFVEFVRGRAG